MCMCRCNSIINRMHGATIKIRTTIVLCIFLQFLYVYELSSNITQTTTYTNSVLASHKPQRITITREKKLSAFHCKNRYSLRQLNASYQHSVIKYSLLTFKAYRNTALQRVTKACSLSTTSVHVIRNQDLRWGIRQTLIKTVSLPTVQPWQVNWHHVG